MCDDSQTPVKKKQKDRTLRFDLELKEPADKDSYIHVDYLELCIAKKVRNWTVGVESFT